MWIEVSEAVLGDSNLSPSSKIIYFILSTSDTPFFTYDELSVQCGLSVKDVRAAIKLLRGEPTARRKNTRKWIRTERIKRGDATATKFTVLCNLTKGKVYGQQETLQKGRLPHTKLTKGKVTPTPINLPNGEFCPDTNLPKGKFTLKMTSLIKEISKDISKQNIYMREVPYTEIFSIYEDIRVSKTKLGGRYGWIPLFDLDLNVLRAANRAWFEDVGWGESLEKVKQYFDAASEIVWWKSKKCTVSTFEWIVSPKQMPLVYRQLNNSPSTLFVDSLGEMEKEYEKTV